MAGATRNFLIFASIIAFIYMIVMNILANSLPVNNLTTGDISDMYPNLFAPAGFAFSIWGLIYLLVLFYVIYQAGIIRFKDKKVPEASAMKIRVFFIISSLANGLWILSWHHLLIPVSLVLMGIIFYSLMKICGELARFPMGTGEGFFMRLPFSIYFGWISVACLANIIVLLVSTGWDAKSSSGIFATIAFLAAGVALTGFFTLRNRDFFYGLVPVWAYCWILFRHLSPDLFASRYISIIITAGVSLIVLIGFLAFHLIKSRDIGVMTEAEDCHQQ